MRALLKVHCFLGTHRVKGGINTDLDKIDQIYNLQASTNKGGVKSTLGLGIYYKCFIKSYCVITVPGSSEEVYFKWSLKKEEASNAHGGIKMVVISFFLYDDFRKQVCNMIDFFLHKEEVNKIELGIKKGPNGIGKCKKWESIEWSFPTIFKYGSAPSPGLIRFFIVAT